MRVRLELVLVNSQPTTDSVSHASGEINLSTRGGFHWDLQSDCCIVRSIITTLMTPSTCLDELLANYPWIRSTRKVSSA